MKLQSYMSMPIGVVVTSCYIFPFVLASFPVANSKMIMAAIGIMLYGIGIYRNAGNNYIGRDFLQLTLWGLAVSFVAWLATVVNNTHDYTYATYIVSMWVWIGGGFTAVSCIRKIHGYLSVKLVVNYLLAVCVMQCVLALVFDTFPDAYAWRNHTFTGEAYMGATDEDRLAGIGCALDVAGLRFAAVLTMTAYFSVLASRKRQYKLMLLYIVSALFLTVIGDMVSRSTVIGFALGIAYIIFNLIFSKNSAGQRHLATALMFFITLGVLITSLLYNKNESFRNNLRFGFEGFFSMAEKGEWQTNSNDILENMVIWPENAKTWIIGDGYLENPLDNRMDTFDCYYVGPTYHGYYKQTDIGYCRFIFYFGITGLVVFSLYFFKVCNVLTRRFPRYRWMFYMILTMNFIGWCKVSSDLFMVFAPFLCLSPGDGREVKKSEPKLR